MNSFSSVLYFPRFRGIVPDGPRNLEDGPDPNGKNAIHGRRRECVIPGTPSVFPDTGPSMHERELLL